MLVKKTRCSVHLIVRKSKRRTVVVIVVIVKKKNKLEIGKKLCTLHIAAYIPMGSHRTVHWATDHQVCRWI